MTNPPTFLITGATGFVGSRILAELLARGDTVWALARPRPGRSAAMRVNDALGVTTAPRGLRVVHGDLSAPGLGLETGDLRALRDAVTTVVHAGGDPTFFPECQTTFQAGHVSGPCWLLEALAPGGRLTVWTQVSTAYVCGRRTGRVFEHEGDVGQDFRNPYERVKLQAEAAMADAGAAHGVDVRIVRPSVVVGRAPATVGGAPSGLLFDFIRMLAALARLARDAAVPLRLEAAPDAPCNIVPVEYVARATAAFARLEGRTGAICHLVAADGLRQAAVLETLAARVGVRGLRLVDGRREPLADATPAERKLARVSAAYREYLQHDVTFDDSIARRLLGPCGIEAPALDAAALHRLVDQALLDTSSGAGAYSSVLAEV